MALERPRGVGERRDDGDPSVLGEARRRLDLRQHAAAPERAALRERARLVRREPVEAVRGICPEAVVDPVDVGEQEQPVGLDGSGEHDRREVLVDDRLDTVRPALVVHDDRHAAAAARDDEESTGHEVADGVGLEQSPRLGRGHDAPPALAVARDREAARLGQGVRRRRVVHGPDRLRGRGEGRVVGGDEGLGHERDDAQRRVGLQQRLLQEVADHADGLGADDVERGWPRAGVGLALEQQMADLRAVAEGQDELVVARERYERRGGGAEVAPLHVGRDLLTAARQGVAAQGGDDPHQAVADACSAAAGGVSPRTAGGTMRTGRCACCATLCETEPSRADLKVPSPRAPITISSASY